MSSLSNIKAWWKHIDSKIKDGTVNKYSKRVLRKVLEGVVDDNAKLIYIIELKEEQIKDMNILFRPALVANPKLLKENEELKAKLEEVTDDKIILKQALSRAVNYIPPKCTQVRAPFEQLLKEIP